MSNFDNPLDMMASMSEPPKPQPKSSPKKKTGAIFDNPLNNISATEKAKAVGSSLVAGKYIRRTFTFTPSQLDKIKELARELHIAETGIARWLIDEGLAQWERGVRPELKSQSVKLEPKLRDWSQS